LQFSLGVTQKPHSASRAGSMAIAEAPVIHPILPSRGPGRQVLLSTHYEHLHLLSPSKEGPFATPSSSSSSPSSFSGPIRETLVSQADFPLLFESSAFLASPILGDVNDDGITDAILADYDGGIFALGLQLDSSGRRYFHKAQVPRLLVRRQWVTSRLNETLPSTEPPKEDVSDGNGMEEGDPQDKHPYAHDRPNDPYHSYFEYSYGIGAANAEKKLQAVGADLLQQEHSEVRDLENRRNRRRDAGQAVPEIENHKENVDNLDSAIDSNRYAKHRRLQEEENPQQQEHDEQTREQVDSNVVQQQQSADHDSNKQQQDQHQDKEMAVQGDSIVPEEKDQQEDSSTKPTTENEEVQENDTKEATIGVKHDLDEDTSVVDHSGDVQNTPKEPIGDDYYNYHGDDDAIPVDVIADTEEEEDGEQPSRFYADDDVREAGDDIPPYDDYRGYDDYYGRYDTEHEEYYDEKHYVRIPPHILSSPVLAEAPKLYGKEGEMEDLLFVPVSYYLDEDEYEGFFSYKRFEGVTDHGDETEVQRGMYVASALMVYQFGDSPRWGRQEHLDLSTDHSAPVNLTMMGSVPLMEDNSRAGAFALASPTVADIDGDQTLEVLMGTSMGFLYVFDARHLYAKDNWPVQLMYGIEYRVIVEDVLGDTNLEIFVADVGGNVYCLDHKAEQIWHRDLVDSTVGRTGSSFSERASSPMVLGDVDGDGVQDIVMVLRLNDSSGAEANYVFALSAATGKDVKGFPIRVGGKPEATGQPDLGDESVHQKLPAPLLVDLHADQSFLSEYLQREGKAWTPRTRQDSQQSPPHGGSAAGLHIVQPVGSNLIVIEAGSGCTQSISIGQEILAMVQVDDVHGTNSLDLVITTASGNVITLESQAPFHPLNTWNHGEMRGRMNAFSHGYSASQGIFVHDISRQFRDIFGVYVPVTFEIFDNRPNIEQEPDKKIYLVEIRNGKSSSRVLFRKTYTQTGVYTERLYIPYGPGYYVLTAVLKSTHSLVYEDSFHLGYNVQYMDGFAILLWLPLVLASVCIFFCGSRKVQWDDDEFDGGNRDGILGGPLPE